MWLRQSVVYYNVFGKASSQNIFKLSSRHFTHLSEFLRNNQTRGLCINFHEVNSKIERFMDFEFEMFVWWALGLKFEFNIWWIVGGFMTSLLLNVLNFRQRHVLWIFYWYRKGQIIQRFLFIPKFHMNLFNVKQPQKKTSWTT